MVSVLKVMTSFSEWNFQVDDASHITLREIFIHATMSYFIAE